MDRRYDPRSIVTPYAFAVHPDLLGRPLATPLQRLGAIAVDLVVIFFLSQVGGAPLALASAVLLFWLAFRKPGRDVFGKLFRVAVGCLGLLVLVVSAAVILAIRFQDEAVELLEGAGNTVQLSGGATGLAGPGDTISGEASLADALQALQGAFAFRGAETREEAQEIANGLARSGLEMGLPVGDIQTSLAGIIPEDAPWASEADDIIDLALESLAAEAVEEDVEAALVPQENADISEPAALDSIAALNQTIGIVREQRDSWRQQEAQSRAALQEAQQEIESAGIFNWFRSLIDDLGLGFGWAALYLTITHAWWRGTSVGKKLLRIRVVMIDKRPLNWWLSFERAGGYAAGFATGFLGFAQIFWDPNRQAIHDKVSETIVIQDGKEAVPGPWMEEGKAQWAQTGKSEGTPAVGSGVPLPKAKRKKEQGSIVKNSSIGILRSSAAALALALPLLVGCGSGGNDSQAQNAGADSVVAAILGSATETFIPSPPGSPRISPQERANEPLQIAEMGYNHGSSDAPLKVMEISDFGCGYCRRFHEDTYPTIKEIYVDSGLVEWKHLPFVLGMFPNGLEAAMVAECAGEQDQFFTMQDRLFKDQGGWKNTSAPLPFMVAAAEEEGLDAVRLDNCIQGSWREARVRANIRLGQEMGVTGTPTFLVDNRLLPGALPLDSFRDVLDMVLTEKGITPPVR